MKVLHLIDSGGLYGAEKMLLALVREQINLGLCPVILSAGEPAQPEKPLERAAREQGLPLISWRMKPGFNLTGARQIWRWAQDEGFDLMHSHGYKFNVLMGLWPRFIRKLPLMATLHGYVKAQRFSKTQVYEGLDRLVLRQMNCVALVTEAMTREIPRSVISSGKTVVIANGIEAERVRQRSKEGLSGELAFFLESHTPILLAVGRLSHEKGFDRLIDAFKVVRGKYSNAGLIIIGEGGCRESLEKQASDPSLMDAVFLPGYCDSVPALMARSDLLCIPSRTEGLPIVLLEAMVVGVPVCASDVGEIRRVLGEGKGGKVSPVSDSESLGGELLACLQNPGEMSEAAAWGKERVHRDYSSKKMAERYLAVYLQTLTETATG